VEVELKESRTNGGGRRDRGVLYCFGPVAISRIVYNIPLGAPIFEVPHFINVTTKCECDDIKQTGDNDEAFEFLQNQTTEMPSLRHLPYATISILTMFRASLPEPTLSFLYLDELLFVPIDDVQRCLALRCSREILESIFRDPNIVFDSYSSNWVVILQKIFVDVFRIFGVF
jgi:hypothetical protein